MSSPIDAEILRDVALKDAGFAVIAAQCAAEATASAAASLVSLAPAGWDAQLIRFQKQLQEGIFEFLTKPAETKTP